MYEIRKDGAVIALTEAANFIRLHPDGFYLLCPEREAEGVAVNGVPYALSPGGMGACEAVSVVHVDGGAVLKASADTAKSAREETECTARLAGQITAAVRLTVMESAAISDADAVKMKDLFRTWEEALAAGNALIANTVLQKGGKLYRVVQGTVPQAHYPPDGEGMLSLYRPIDVAHAGTVGDPIPLTYGMDCACGKYYLYNTKTYLCTGDMIPCVWMPGTDGVWQWEEVVEDE